MENISHVGLWAETESASQTSLRMQLSCLYESVFDLIILLWLLPAPAQKWKIIYEKQLREVTDCSEHNMAQRNGFTSTVQ